MIIDAEVKKEGQNSFRSRIWPMTELLDRILSGGKFSTREQAELLSVGIEPYIVSRAQAERLYFDQEGRPLEEAAKEVFVESSDGYGRQHPAYLEGGATDDILASTDPRKRKALQQSITEGISPPQSIIEEVLTRAGVRPRITRVIHVAEYKDRVEELGL